MKDKSKKSTVVLSWENKQKLQEISVMFKNLGRKQRMSYDESVCFLLREYATKKHLMARIDDLYNYRAEFIKIVNNYMQKTGSELPIDITKIPELNEFVEDADLKIIRSLKE